MKISKEFNVSVDELLGYQIATDKSLSRLRQENRIVELIKQADNGLLSHLEKYLYLVQNLFKTS